MNQREEIESAVSHLVDRLSGVVMRGCGLSFTTVHYEVRRVPKQQVCLEIELCIDDNLKL